MNSRLPALTIGLSDRAFGPDVDIEGSHVQLYFTEDAPSDVTIAINYWHDLKLDVGVTNLIMTLDRIEEIYSDERTKRQTGTDTKAKTPTSVKKILDSLESEVANRGTDFFQRDGCVFVALNEESLRSEYYDDGHSSWRVDKSSSKKQLWFSARTSKLVGIDDPNSASKCSEIIKAANGIYQIIKPFVVA